MKLFTISGDVAGSREINDEDEARRRFAKMALNQRNWFETAAKLTFAMGQLEPSIKNFWQALASQRTDDETPLPSLNEDSHSIYLMLAGLAIENLCKGYLAGRLEPADKDELSRGRLPATLRQYNHQIAKVIRAAGIETSVEENELIMRIQRSVLWIGRYPIPVGSSGLADEAIAAADIERVGNLLSHIRQQTMDLSA